MPLNSLPPTLDAASFDAKVAAARGRARVDFALWGGLVPGDPARLDALAERGVVGFKAFMCPSGVDEFPAADPDTLGRGMERAAALGLPVAVHAEDPEIVGRLAEEARAAGRTSMAGWAASRPPEAELAAIRLALSLAEQAGCALHVVHVSTAEGAGLVAEARARGVDATCEACPHHLVLDEGDAARIGALAKCAPPLRSSAERRALWGRVAAGAVDLVGLRPLAGAARAQDGGGHVRGVGRDLGRADDAAAGAERGPRPRRRRPRASPSWWARPPPPGWGWRARAAWSRAPTPTSPSCAPARGGRWSRRTSSTATATRRSRDGA